MRTWTRAALSSLILAAATAHAHSGPDGEPSVAPTAGAVGVVSFANSGSAAAQASFQRGLALLHNFEYERAAAEFRKAESIDAGFAMAYWGEAMTYNHPVWMEQDAAAARAALAKLGATPRERAARAGTQRERDYLAAVETLYGEGSKEERDFRYEAAMGALQARYPNDVDAAALHALAILGTAHAGRDFATYMRAAAILEEIYPQNMDHPGVLHYLIHSYDDPIHAPLGLRAARRYGAVAPDAGHALHMTSHIFVALGMWDDSIAVNERALAVVDAQRKAQGKGPAYCGHYASWLVYSYLQERKAEPARRYIDGCRSLASEELAARSPTDPDPDNSLAGSYLQMRNMLVVDAGEWKAGDALPLQNATDWQRFAAAYGAALAASAAGDRTALAMAAGELDRLAPLLKARLDAEHDPSESLRAAIEATRLQGNALVALRQGDADAGIATLRQAARIEAAAPMEFGPPIVAKPSDELLGDELMRLGRYAEAVSAYEKAIARTPGRTLAVEGLARAKRAGQQPPAAGAP